MTGGGGNAITESDTGSGDGYAGGSGGGGGGEDVLVVLTLGSPEVDSGTGNTVFSLSAEEQVGDGSRERRNRRGGRGCPRVRPYDIRVGALLY